MWAEDDEDDKKLVEGDIYAIVPMNVFLSWKKRTALQEGKNIDLVSRSFSYHPYPLTPFPLNSQAPPSNTT